MHYNHWMDAPTEHGAAMETFLANRIWLGKDLRSHKVDTMTADHITNCLNLMLRRRAENAEPWTSAPQLAARWVELFENELHERGY